MTEEIIRNIADMLRGEFGEEYEIYTEGVYQGAKKPCIFIECEKSERVNLLGKNFYIRNTVLISIDDERRDKRVKAASIAGDIFNILNCVKTDAAVLWGRNIHGKWDKGNFNIRASYNVFTKEKEEDAPVMEYCEIEKELGI